MKKKREGLSVVEAVDNLSTMAELDISALPQEGELTVLPIEKEYDFARVVQDREAVRETFRVIHDYLEHLYNREKGELKDPEMQRGIQAIMVLAGEAAQKMDKYSAVFKGALKGESVSQLKEYKMLQQLYLTKIVKRFHKTLEKEEAWQKEWEDLEDKEGIDLQKKSLRDMEVVRRDRDYELFFIRKENGQPYFNAGVLRHLRLVGEFDETLIDPAADDPLLKIKEIQDHDAHLAAKEILHSAASHLDNYYRDAFRFKERDFVASLNKAVMALMLASNTQNLLTNKSNKSCFAYFSDFQSFLRASLYSDEYRNYLSNPFDPADKLANASITLAHELAMALFLRTPRRKETLRFIQHLLEQAQEKKPEQPFWNELLDKDETIRAVLKRYPPGPLLKALEAFREGEEHLGFDPLSMGNFPHQLYTFIEKDTHTTVLRLPAPTRQEIINKAEVVPEFYAFLRALKTQMQGQRHLLFNLQDRTSWQEHARCVALENLQKQAEFATSLIVVTLCKDGEFYLQNGSYINLDEATLFIQTFQQQIESREACGYHFPLSLDGQEINAFTKHALAAIHANFFSSQEKLSRKSRLDFIEIFTQFLILKIISMLAPHSISFSCKDAVDTGEAESAGFYAFLKLLTGELVFNREEQEFLVWMFYDPALHIRHRAIDSVRLTRMVSALSILTAELQAHPEKLSAIYRLLTKPVKVLPLAA